MSGKVFCNVSARYYSDSEKKCLSVEIFNGWESTLAYIEEFEIPNFIILSRYDSHCYIYELIYM